MTMMMKTHFSILRCPWVVACILVFASIARAQQTAAPSAPYPQTSAAPSDFAAERLLMQQGKLDDAIAELQSLQANTPD